MVALARNFPRPARKLGKKHTIPVNGGSRIRQGSLVMRDAEGYGRPAAALANNRGCPGVALTEVDNTTGADGDRSVVVQEGEFLFDGTTLAVVSEGGRVYAEDDNTVDETQAANEPQAGILSTVVSASSAWIKVGQTEAIV